MHTNIRIMYIMLNSMWRSYPELSRSSTSDLWQTVRFRHGKHNPVRWGASCLMREH